MSTVGMHEAKTRLSELVHEVEDGGDVVITRHGRPVARLVHIAEPKARRGFGALRGGGGVVDLTWAEITAGDAAVAALFAAATD